MIALVQATLLGGWLGLDGFAYGLMVLTLRTHGVAAITGFPYSSVFAHFGLTRTLPE